MVSRRYRNRRIGELLKELEFTEGRRTGIPKMRRALKHNGSPEPRFYTDGARLSFWTEINVHPAFLEERVPTFNTQVTEATVEAIVEATVEAHLSETELGILRLCLKHPVSRKEILSNFGHKTFSGNMQLALKRLKEMEFITPTIVNKPNSKNQRYKLTVKGEKLLKNL